jgi:uncharacterized membrane protein YkoI
MRLTNPRLILGAVLAAIVVIGGAGTMALMTANASDGPCQGVDAATLPISNEQAQSIAVAQVAGAVREIKLDCENSRTIYEVEVQPQAGGRQMEIEIDATSGAVLKVEAD